MAEFVSDFFQLASMQPAWIRLLMVGFGGLLVAFMFGAGMAFVDAVMRQYVGYKTSQEYRRRHHKIDEDALRFMDRRGSVRQAAEEDQRRRLDAIMKERAS